jgi:phage-related holin
MVFNSKASAWTVFHILARTQTKIKNYFYGNIRYLLKIILKFAFGKNRTGFVNDIKT